jgi:cytochrome P450
MQTTLRTEVRNALSAAEPSDLCSIMESLPYLNGVMHETLRIYPTAPILFRVAAVDTHMLGNWVPRGTRVVIPPWIMNRSPELWGEDAEEFRPQRWIDANGRPNSTGGGEISILTFLHGPRGCIGENFSKAELRCLIASMVSQFEWTLDMPKEDVVPAGAITIRPANGLHLKLKEVKA